MIPYKHTNGCLMARDVRGKFRHFTMEELIGLKMNDSYMVCSSCGHGESESWMPVLATGRCPKCGNTEGNTIKLIPLSKAAEDIMEQINEVENSIGISFPNPYLLNSYQNKLLQLNWQLNQELKKCNSAAFHK